MVPEHFQPAIATPTSVFAKALVSTPVALTVLNGERVTVPIAVGDTFCAVTVTTPKLLVEIDATYLDDGEALSPQPQPSVPGKVEPVEP